MILTEKGSGARAFSDDWLAASTQSFGTVLFNVSTSAALTVGTVQAEKHHVWRPDFAGSVAFLISGVLVVIAYTRAETLWNPRDVDWWATQINMLGCIAFMVSAVAAYVTSEVMPSMPRSRAVAPSSVRCVFSWRHCSCCRGGLAPANQASDRAGFGGQLRRLLRQWGFGRDPGIGTEPVSTASEEN
ncbi:hypothetical protein ABLE92_17835 [Gordonia sp. VNQ95]|uniref:hypothetical protein n=1 Tax=Gordonia TaxID=2053 RepID=UPI0032B3452F